HGAWLSFSDAPLLDNAELHIEDNERVCLVGRNGAGKSTLMKILNREQGLDDGRIIYEQDLIVARLQQDPPRNVEGSVYDFVAEGIEEQAEYLKRYHDISRLVMNDPSEKNLNELAKVQEQLDHHNLWQLENRINEVLAQLGLDPNVALSSLSGGWLRKAALGRALVSNPRVLLLDEPTNHLDLDMRQALTEALIEFEGALVVVSHDRHLLRSTTDDLYLVHDRKVEPFDGDLEDYQQWLSDVQKQENQTDEAPKENANSAQARKDQKRREAELRAQTQPLRKEIARLEKEMEKLNAQLAQAEEKLGDSELYDQSRKAELTACLQQQASAKSGLE
ncbi:ATP-binding cassette domain-containing protein, partial [Salmonella enterica]|uniref:ATP-binding cassette domain-containing protein n=1 Tax=Salmonella enterica TaxID=28901 RepID=UPI003FA72390